MILQVIADHLQTRGITTTLKSINGEYVRGRIVNVTIYAHIIINAPNNIIVGLIDIEDNQVRCHRLSTYPTADAVLHTSDPHLLQYIETWCLSIFPTFDDDMLHPLDVVDRDVASILR